MSNSPRKKAQPKQLSWREQNVHVMALGMAWLDVLQVEGVGADVARSEYDQARETMRAANSPAALDRLSQLFALSPFDEDLLLLLLHAQHKGTPKQVIPHVALDQLVSSSADSHAMAWTRLGPYAPLRRYQLLESNERPLASHTPLFIDERIGQLLMGEDAADRRIEHAITSPQPGRCPDQHKIPIDKLAQSLKSARLSKTLLIGPKRSGRRAAAAELALQFGLGLAEIRPRGLDSSTEIISVLAREALLMGFALVIDIDEPDAQRCFEEKFKNFDGLVIAIAEARPDLAFEIPVLRLEPLDSEARSQLWLAALGPHSAELHSLVEPLSEQFKFGPREIAAIAAQGTDLWQACKDRAGRELENLAQRIVPHYTWDDIELPIDVLLDLRAAAAQVRYRTRVYGEHGFARKMVRGRGISVLLSGPSGTGKTMAAEVIAHDLNLDLYRIDLSSVVSKYIGETEKNLRRVFDEAETSGAVLFFDEADALFGKRSEVKDSHDRHANVEVSYLLQRMEAYSGLAILATNLKGNLDNAFLRRLRFVVEIPFPDAAARRQIWVKTFPHEMPKEELDYDALARLDIAGGNISVIAINAAFLAATEDKPLAMSHIARAAKSEFRKLDKELRLNVGLKE